MRVVSALIFAIGLSVVTAAADAAAAAAVAEPDWAVEEPLPTATDAIAGAATGGVVYLLVDDQFAWDGQTRIHYARRALRVLDRAGLERAAVVDWDFAPDFDSIALTRLEVRRDGRRIDLRGSIRPEMLRRETRLEAGIIDGSLTAHYVLPDLRVGDVVDYSFVITENPIVPGATFAGELPLEFGSPVAVAHAAINWPASRPLHVGPVSERVGHSSVTVTSPDGPVTRHEWRRNGHVPNYIEPLTPVESNPDAVVRYSADVDWRGLVATLAPFYTREYRLPPAWDGRVTAIAHDFTDPLERATAALRLVQDEIRYVGLEVGAGGIYARLPDVVVAQGFGDCKDKSLLLKTVLARLGIDSEVALTDLDEGYALPQSQPWIGAFDHMIVRLEVAGKTYWVDPTGSHEGGRLDHAVTPDYGFALPISADGAGRLEPIVPSEATAWQTDTREHYRFGALGVWLTVTTTFEGQAADAQRYRLATEPVEAIGRGLTEFYSGRYPGIGSLGQLAVADDPQLNRIVTTERYLLPVSAMFENDLWGNFEFGSEDFGGYFPRASAAPRLRPMTLGGVKRHRHTVEVEDAPVPFEPPEKVEIANPAFAFRFSGYADEPGSLTLEWDFRTRDRVIQADDVAQVLRDARRIGEISALVWNLDPAQE